MRRGDELRKLMPDDSRVSALRVTDEVGCVKTNRSIKIGTIGLLLGIAASSYGFSWPLVNAKIRHDFPNVKRITTRELAGWMNDPQRAAPLLLDVRTRAEYEVSHLQNGRRVEPDAVASIVTAPTDQPIVTYCSVGYRSGGFAEKLRAAGYTNVANLEGSIFRWANENRPVYRDDPQVQTVHPYDRIWGSLLQKKYRAKVPAG